MRFNEEVSFDFADKYVFRINSRQSSSTRVNLVVTLKDIIDGKPYYVGAWPVDIVMFSHSLGKQKSLIDRNEFAGGSD